MKRSIQLILAHSAILSIAVGFAGCVHHGNRVTADSPMPLGTQTDEIWRTQENNAEAAKYVVYEHEFVEPDILEGQVSGGWKLNAYGEDHVKQIAANLNRGDLYPVLVERSQISPKSNTEYRYPIHFNEELDKQRRRVIVASLVAMGVEDAEERVIVSPSFAEGISGTEARRAYFRGLSGRQSGGMGWGGWGGGYGGFGGGGFF